MLPVYFPGRKKRELHTKITVITINCCNSEVHNIRVYTALNFMFPGEQRLYIHKIRHLCKYYNAVVQALKKKNLTILRTRVGRYILRFGTKKTD